MPLHSLATLGFVGRLPAPGTCGSLVALGLFVPIGLFLSWQWQAMAVLFVSCSGIAICQAAIGHFAQQDPSAVVWDELAGMWLALLAAPDQWWYWVAALLLFRLLDIAKPGPIGWCDKRLSGGWGVMADDLAAGLATLLCMQAIWWLYSTAW